MEKENLFIDDKGKLRFEGEYLYNFKLKGKEYIREILEYEGDFIYNQKWNGKGYDKKGNIIYELNNGNGKSKEYDKDGRLMFEGEYLNGKRTGKGKEYDFLGKLDFYGEYLNGKKWNGMGKEYVSVTKWDAELRIYEYLEGKRFYNY